MRRYVCFFSGLFLLSASVIAADNPQAPVAESHVEQQVEEAFTPDLTLSIDTWPRVGKARLKVLFWEVYDSALYTPSGNWTGMPPYQLSLSYLRDIPVHQLVNETEKAWRQQGVSHEQLAVWLQALGKIWPDIGTGDSLVFGVAPEGRNGFWFNGAFIGGIDHPDFGPLFAGIWLSENSPRPALRAQLIGADAP
jgi:hypothetical protein